MWGGAWTGLWRAERQQEDLLAGLVFGNSSGRRHDKVLVGGGGVNSQASLPCWVLMVRGIQGFGNEKDME